MSWNLPRVNEGQELQDLNIPTHCSKIRTKGIGTRFYLSSASVPADSASFVTPSDNFFLKAAFFAVALALAALAFALA